MTDRDLKLEVMKLIIDVLMYSDNNIQKMSDITRDRYFVLREEIDSKLKEVENG